MTSSKTDAIVTGASQGIGRATALRLACDFSVVVLVARDKDKLGQTATHNLSVEDAITKFPEQAGIARLGKPEEIADLMGYLVSPAARWITGASVRMDGGEIKGI